MKKLTALISTTILGLIASSAFAASNTASHNVRVEIPAVMMIRIADTTGNNAATNPTIVFNLLNSAGYQGLDGSTLTSFSATNTNEFGAVEVLANTGWNVNVSATETATDTGGSTIPSPNMDLARIKITPTSTGDPSITNPLTSFDLTETGAIASGTKTSGWKSIGIEGSSYGVLLNGSETPGTYVYDVTYTIAAP